MKKLLSIILFILLAYTVQAQEKTETTPYHNEFGIHAGGVTGVGLSYRYWGEKNGFQLTVMPPIVKSDYKLYSAGATYLRSFKDKKWMRVFGYAGIHYWNESSETEYVDWDPIAGAPFNNIQHNNLEEFNVGFGPGISFGTKVRVSLMVGYGFYDILDKFDAYPTGEIGVYYNF